MAGRSRYRDDLFPPTERLRAEPGRRRWRQPPQYFGEKYVGDKIKLAKNAIVLLHHLCYASGNCGAEACPRARSRRRSSGSTTTPPGSSEPERPRCRRMPTRVRPTDPLGAPGLPLDRPDLARRPSANGHTFAFKSSRSHRLRRPDGPRQFEIRVPSIDRPLRKGLASKDVLASGNGSGAPSVANPAEEAAAAEPTLIDQGIKVEAPKVRGMTTAGAEKLLRIPLEVKDRDKLPKKLKASVRWDPIESRSCRPIRRRRSKRRTPQSPKPRPSRRPRRKRPPQASPRRQPRRRPRLPTPGAGGHALPSRRPRLPSRRPRRRRAADEPEATPAAGPAAEPGATTDDAEASPAVDEPATRLRPTPARRLRLRAQGATPAQLESSRNRPRRGDPRACRAASRGTPDPARAGRRRGAAGLWPLQEVRRRLRGHDARGRGPAGSP